MPRRPKANSVALSEGDPRKLGKRKLLERLQAEPRAVHGLPECPRFLRGRARWAWGFIRRDMEAMDLDFRPDTLMMVGICRTFARAVEDDTPAAWSAFRLMATEFPLSPVARTRLSLAKQEPKVDELSAVLSRPREKRAEIVQ